MDINVELEKELKNNSNDNDIEEIKEDKNFRNDNLNEIKVLVNTKINEIEKKKNSKEIKKDNEDIKLNFSINLKKNDLIKKITKNIFETIKKKEKLKKKKTKEI